MVVYVVSVSDVCNFEHFNHTPKVFKNKVDAEKEKEVAQINAEKAKIEAQGKADAELIKANAEAEANKKIAESLTDKLIEKAKYDKWNGELPYIEGASTPIVNIKETEKTE